MSTAIPIIKSKSILTPTSGYLMPQFTHSLQPYVGCGFAGAVCGTYCYAQHNHWITKGRPWGIYGKKDQVEELYRKDYDRIKRPRRGGPKPLRIYMSSSTDPYMPQERKEALTRTLLKAMLDRVPDAIVIQTHSTLIIRDISIIKKLSNLCNLWVSITVETDQECIPGFPPHASSPKKRIETLLRFHSEGVQTQAAVSPLLPIANTDSFARDLDRACDRVVLNHYLLSDGSKNGMRTQATQFPGLLEQNGFGEWNTLTKYDETRRTFEDILGAERVLISSMVSNSN